MTDQPQLSEAEQADIDCAFDFLMRYEGNSKFMLDVQGKARRIDGFKLSHKQADVILKIADEEHARSQQDEAPF